MRSEEVRETLMTAITVLAMLLGVSVFTMFWCADAFGSVPITFEITPHPVVRDGTVLVIGAVPYAEQRCVVHANRCVVTMTVAPDFASAGAVTIRESTDKEASNFFGWTQCILAAQPSNTKRRAVRH